MAALSSAIPAVSTGRSSWRSSRRASKRTTRPATPVRPAAPLPPQRNPNPRRRPDSMLSDFQVSGANKNALFTLKLHRGDGMALIAMNWKKGTPPNDFVGFAIEYKEPGGDKFFAVKNRLCFPGPNGEVIPNGNSSRLSPIQKFRWVHFPRNAEKDGEFLYRATPVFMNDKDELSYGESQEAALAGELASADRSYHSIESFACRRIAAR